MPTSQFPRRTPSWLTAVAFVLSAGLNLQAGVKLSTSLSSPQPVATMIRWTAADESGSATTWYRFRVRELDGKFTMIRDFGPYSELDWTAADREGTFEFEVTAQDTSTGNTTTTSELFDFTPRAMNGIAAVNQTGNALVFLYSAPPCPDGQSMVAKFRGADGPTQKTPPRNCDGTYTVNVYLAGLRTNSAYEAWHEVSDGETVSTSDPLTFLTGDSPVPAPTSQVLTQNTAPESVGLILHAPLFPNPPVATDAAGNLLWYYATPISYLTRIEDGGHFFGIVNSPGDQSAQALREFDLAGMTLKETNAARVSQQLQALGMRPVSGFHHEARRLSDGNIVVLAGVEQMLPMGEGGALVDVEGDMIVVLNDDLQVTWAWDAFDHLDVNRAPTLGEKCSAGACPKLLLAKDAIDWTHTNSLHQAQDGSLLISLRHQDWLLKIDYGGGTGSGQVLWRLGLGGDFAIDSPDAAPWFSHQHDAQFISAAGDKILLFDNSNIRHAADPSANSRGQVLEIDETTRTARLALNVDLGNYSFAMGAAQLLPSGNYYFDQPWLPDNSSIATFVAPAGDLLYEFQVGQPEYRTFWLQDVYTGPSSGIGELSQSRQAGSHATSAVSGLNGGRRNRPVAGLSSPAR